MSRTGQKVIRTTRSASIVNVPAPSPEVTGGKAQNAWTVLHEREDSADIVSEIVDELIRNVDACIFERYLAKQLIPFTVFKAKQDIIHVVEWLYLKRDHGPETDEATWCQDCEPNPLSNDSWAQGCVPKACINDQQLKQSQQQQQQQQQQQLPVNNQSEEVPVDSCSGLLDVDKIECGEMSADEALSSQVVTGLDDYVPHVHSCEECGALPADDETGEECGINNASNNNQQSDVCIIVPQQTSDVSENRSAMLNSDQLIPGVQPIEADSRNKDVIQKRNQFGWFDDDRKISVKLDRLSPKNLPNNRVNTLYTILSTQGEAKVGTNQQNKQRNNNKIDRRVLMTKEPISDSDEHKRPIKPTGAFDSMEMSAGVNMKQLNRTKTGAKPQKLSGALKGYDERLQPIRSEHSTALVDIRDIIDESHPVIRAPVPLTPVPPITRTQIST